MKYTLFVLGLYLSLSASWLLLIYSISTKDYTIGWILVITTLLGLYFNKKIDQCNQQCYDLEDE